MDEDILELAKAFCNAHQVQIGEALGFGIHGRVWVGESPMMGALAIKIFRMKSHYLRERDAYRRLAEYEVTSICGCRVPQLVIEDDEFLALGITIVKRPFVLDFAGSQLDWPLDFEPEIMAAWMAEKEAQFGEDDWPVVLEILGELESMGIYLTDITPSNISLIDRRA